MNLLLFLVTLTEFLFQENYNFLLALEEELLKSMQSGTKLSAVYEAGVSYVKKEKPNLITNLTKNFG